MVWHTGNRLSKKKSWILVSSLVVLTVISLIFYKHFSGNAVFTGKDKSIAVLPFANLSKNIEKDYISEGITDEIIIQLSKIKGLRVIARSSIASIKVEKADVKEIAGRLHVSAVLEGGIEKSGNTLKIHARLVDIGSGKIIWEETYDRDINDIFSIQAELATVIADKLNAELTISEKNKISERPTQNLEAYDQFQQGRKAWFKGGDSALRKGIYFFNRAIALDSTFSRAYSGLADCYSALGYGSYELPSSAFLKAESAAVKALELDSTLADPHSSLGYIKFYYYWDWVGAEKEFLKAIELNPTYVIAYDSYGYFLTAMERFPESRIAFDKAFQLDPLSAKINTDIGFNCYYSKNYEQALISLENSLKISNKPPLTHIWLGRTYEENKRFEEAVQEYTECLKTEKNWPVALAAIGHVFGISGQRKSAEKILAQMNALIPTKYVTPYGLALVYSSLDAPDSAFEYLEKAYSDRSNWMVWLKLDPRWKSLRHDKRYAALITKVGLRLNAGPFSKEF